MIRVFQRLIYDRYDPPVTKESTWALLEGLLRALIEENAYALHLKFSDDNPNLFGAWLRNEKGDKLKRIALIDSGYLDPILGCLLVIANLPCDGASYPDHEWFEFSIDVQLESKIYRVPVFATINPIGSRAIILKRPHLRESDEFET